MRWIRGSAAVVIVLIGSAAFAQASVSPGEWVQKSGTITIGSAGTITGPTATTTTPVITSPTAPLHVNATATPDAETLCAVDIGLNDGTAEQISVEGAVDCNKTSTVSNAKMVIQQYLHFDMYWATLDTRTWSGTRQTPTGSYGPVEVGCTSGDGTRATFSVDIKTPNGSAPYSEQEDGSCR